MQWLCEIGKNIKNVEIAFHKYGKDDSMVKAKVYI